MEETKTNLTFDEIVNEAEKNPDRFISLSDKDFESITGMTVFVDVP